MFHLQTSNAHLFIYLFILLNTGTFLLSVCVKTTFIFLLKSNYVVAAWISQRPLLGFKSCLIRNYNKELTEIYSSLDEWLQGPAEVYEFTLHGSAINAGNEHVLRGEQPGV